MLILKIYSNFFFFTNTQVFSIRWMYSPVIIVVVNAGLVVDVVIFRHSVAAVNYEPAVPLAVFERDGIVFAVDQTRSDLEVSVVVDRRRVQLVVTNPSPVRQAQTKNHDRQVPVQLKPQLM